ncbi:hypothetical protein ABPG74_010651 [Tetrahymena malaccensis]
MDHQDYEVLGRKRGKFNPQIYLNKKVYEIDRAQLKHMQKMDMHEVLKLVQRILKKAIANRENDDVTVLFFYFKDMDFIQKLQNKFDEQTFLQVISHITYKKYQRNEIVCKQGQIEKQMYFILEGKACVKKYDVIEYEKRDGTFGIRKICLLKQMLQKGDSFCREILKGNNYDEIKYCSYSVYNLDQMLECAVLRRDHYLGFKISMEIKQEINKVNLIQSSCIFNYHLNPRQLKALSQNFHLKKSFCNNIIYNEGDEADGIYIIKSGRFKIQKSTNYNYNFEDLDVNNFKIAQSKKYSEIAILGEGQCFGDEEIFKNYDKRIFTVSCDTAIGEYFQISKKDFFRVLSQQFKDEDWKELENAFQLKNDWRKENIAQIQKVKQQFVEYMGAPPKYSCEAKLLKLTMSNKKQVSPKNERSSSPQPKEVINTLNTSYNEPQKTFELTQINNLEQLSTRNLPQSSQMNTPTSNRYLKKVDQYLQQKDLAQTKQKIDTEYGFYRKSGVKSSLGTNEEVDTRHNTSTSMSNQTSNQQFSNQLKVRNEILPRNIRSQSVQNDNNLVKIGQMFKSGGKDNFLQTNQSRGNSPYIQNQYPHQKELILPEINYKEHSTIDIRFRHPSPFTKRFNPSSTNGKTQYKYGFGSAMQSPSDMKSIQYYDGTSSKKTPSKTNYNQTGNFVQMTNRSNISTQYQDGDIRSQSPYRLDEISNRLGANENKFTMPLKRMDIADITYNKAIILKTKNFTTDEEKGRVIAFEGSHFLPTELDSNYLEKKGIIKKKIDPKKRETENQQSMEKGKKILENFILGYLVKKKKAQTNKKQNNDKNDDNIDDVAQVQMYNFPQGKMNTQFYGKSKNKLKKKIHSNVYNEEALSPQPVPKNYTNLQTYSLDNQKEIIWSNQQLQFSPIQAKSSIKENSNQIPLITLEQSPTKLSIQQDSIKNKIIQDSVMSEQPKKQSQKSIFTGKTFNQRKNSKQMIDF